MLGPSRSWRGSGEDGMSLGVFRRRVLGAERGNAGVSDVIMRGYLCCSSIGRSSGGVVC